jgi:thioredoxin reductase (NADPH)
MLLEPTKLYGTPNSPEGYNLRDFLMRSGIPFEWHNLRTDKEAQVLLGVHSLSDERLPVCILKKGSILFNPSLQEVAQALDWFKDPKHRYYDLAIYGAGPAGLSAAVYGASEALRTIVIERRAVGGQAGSTSRIENYLGFPRGISGWELASRARQQAQRLGAEIIVTDEGVDGEARDGWMISRLASGPEIFARSTICATGVAYTRLGLSNEEKYLGRGLYYGAGSSEASQCTDHVFVIGSGNSAGQAAVHFAQFAKKVSMLVRGVSLKDTLSAYLVDQIAQRENIEVHLRSELTDLHGSDCLHAITVRNLDSGEHWKACTEQVFVCIGGTPQTQWAKQANLCTDKAGYIVTGEDLDDGALARSVWTRKTRPLHMETSIPGLFAAGDVRHGSVKRCATAVGEGATAVSMVHQFLALNPVPKPR